MADHGHHAHDDPSSGGTMDMAEKVESWLAFWKATKVSVGILITLAILLAIFRTHNGMY